MAKKLRQVCGVEGGGARINNPSRCVVTDTCAGIMCAVRQTMGESDALHTHGTRAGLVEVAANIHE